MGKKKQTQACTTLFLLLVFIVGAKQQEEPVFSAKKIRIISYSAGKKQETATVASAIAQSDNSMQLVDISTTQIQKESFQLTTLTAKKAKFNYSIEGFFKVKPIKIWFFEELIIKDTDVSIKSSEGVYIFAEKKIFSSAPTVFKHKTYDFISKEGFSGELKSGAVNLLARQVDGVWKEGEK
jgi:hypothetical protein